MQKVEVSNITKNKRAQIKSLQDKFMTFSWRGLDAFENFGAFILNDKKGSLKFYNGPGFSNKYSSPQFSSNVGDLDGISFNRQHITFKIGVYWITIEDYRKLLSWLDPFAISNLTFGFASKFGYRVKLATIKDSTRWIVGNENGNPAYYTELDLDFEVQGPQCATGNHSYEINNTLRNGNHIMKIRETTDFIESDLPTPIEVTHTFDIITNNENYQNKSLEYLIKLDAVYNEERINLYSVSLKNLTTTYKPTTNLIPLNDEDVESVLTIGITYHSESGLLYLKYADSTDKILTLTTTSDTGERIVSSFSSNKFTLPGRLKYPDFNTIKNFELECSVTILNSSFSTVPNEFFRTDLSSLVCYPRTNVI